MLECREGRRTGRATSGGRRGGYRRRGDGKRQSQVRLFATSQRRGSLNEGDVSHAIHPGEHVSERDGLPQPQPEVDGAIRTVAQPEKPELGLPVHLPQKEDHLAHLPLAPHFDSNGAFEQVLSLSAVRDALRCRMFRGWAPPNRCLYPGDKVGWGEGLQHIIVGQGALP